MPTVPPLSAGGGRGDLLDSAGAGRGGRSADLARAPGFLLCLERARAARQRHADGARDVAALCADRLLRRARRQRAVPGAAPASITGEDLPAAKRMAPTLGFAERPLGPARWDSVTTRDLYRAILDGKPYPIRGLIGFGSNMLLAHVDGGHGRKALAALEFYAHADLFMTPTAELADVVLPVASAFEREALKIGFEISPEAQSLIQFRQAVVPPPGEARPDTDIVFDLAGRLGLGAQFLGRRHRSRLPPSTRRLPASRSSSCAPPRAACACRLQTRYAKYAEPDANGEPRGFATPSRKVELYSQTFLDHGYAPLPDFEEPQIGPVARPDLAARFPLVLTNAKPTLFCQTQHRALPSLRKRAPHPEVELHPDAAQARRIANGDWVSIETPEGSVRARARLNDRPRSARGDRRAWLVAGLRRDRRAWVRSVRAGRRQSQSDHRPRLRSIRSAARRRTAPICARSDARPENTTPATARSPLSGIAGIRPTATSTAATCNYRSAKTGHYRNAAPSR